MLLSYAQSGATTDKQIWESRKWSVGGIILLGSVAQVTVGRLSVATGEIICQWYIFEPGSCDHSLRRILWNQVRPNVPICLVTLILLLVIIGLSMLMEIKCA